VKKEVVASDYGSMSDQDNAKRFLTDYFADIPILAKIAGCESHNRQFNSSGSVIRGEVNHYDVGLMQVNELYHLDTAEKLGYDIYSPDGNVAYGRYLYGKFGTQPWASSKACWGKYDTGSDVAINK